MKQSTKKQSFSPRLEALEERSLMATNVFFSGGVLNIVGDRAADRVLLYDNGGSTVSGIASGQGAFSYNGVRDIVIDTGGGNDTVQYNLVSDLKAHVVRTVNVNLRDGDDIFVANLKNPGTGQASNFQYGSLMLMKVVGEAGQDDLRFLAENVKMDHATMKIGFYGGMDDDFIGMVYSGLNDHGGVSYFAYGEGGDDTIATLVNVDPASVAPAPGGIRAVVDGGDNDDLLILQVIAPNAVTHSDTHLDGGMGNDVAITDIDTAHINNAETVFFIP